MTLKKPTACLLDLDGTLMRHKNPKLIANLERIDTVIHILTHPFKRSKTVPTEMDLTVNVESNPLAHRLMHGIRIMRGIAAEDVVEPEKAAEKFLKFLKSKNILIGLSSNAYGRSYGKPVLRYYGLRDYFDALLFRENVRHGKPYAEPVLRAIYSLGLDEDTKQVIWFIGDQAKDMKAIIAAQKYLPKKWMLIPMAFKAKESTAYIYLSRKKARLKGVSSENYVRDFHDALSKLKKLRSYKNF